jgi:hypothetical protein
MHLSTIFITETEGALAAESVSPETPKVNIGLRHLRVGNEEPDAEDGLGEDVKNSVGDNLRVNRDLARSVGNTPDTTKY